MNLHDAFKIGALRLAQDEARYSELHKSHGIEEQHWALLTQREYWSQDQARQIRTILASVVEVSMTIAGMPAIPLPGQYVAAVIATIVAPPNRFLACTKAPDTFDASDASGILRTHEIQTMSVQQLMALVLAYSGGYQGEPPSTRIGKEVEEVVIKANDDKPKSRRLNG